MTRSERLVAALIVVCITVMTVAYLTAIERRDDQLLTCLHDAQCSEQLMGRR